MSDDIGTQLAAALVNEGIYDYVNIGGRIETEEKLGAFIAEFLARWRLVPVEEACRCIAGNEHYKSDHAAQHRAADELTQHDQDAGHYDRCTSVHDMLWRCELQAGHNGPHEG